MLAVISVDDHCVNLATRKCLKSPLVGAKGYQLTGKPEIPDILAESIRLNRVFQYADSFVQQVLNRFYVCLFARIDLKPVGEDRFAVKAPSGASVFRICHIRHKVYLSGIKPVKFLFPPSGNIAYLPAVLFRDQIGQLHEKAVGLPFFIDKDFRRVVIYPDFYGYLTRGGRHAEKQCKNCDRQAATAEFPAHIDPLSNV